MNNMNMFGDLVNQLQGQLDNYTNRLTRPRSSASKSRRRGGEPGEKIPSGYREVKLNQYTPEQLQLYGQLFSDVGPDSYLRRLAGGDEELFNDMEAPAMRQFNALQGNLASRFSGMGMGARNSSGFQNTANQYASDFAQDIASKRQQLQRQALEDLRGMSMELLNQRPYEKFLVQKPQPYQEPYEPSTFDQILGGVGSFFGGAGQAVGKKLGNKFFG